MAKANGALLAFAARVGRHHDNGIFKIHLAAVGVGDLSVIENLQQDVHHIGMRLFNLVEEDDGVGLAADLLGELTGLVIADIARRRADDAGDRVLFHEFRHIEANERVGRIEEILCKLLDKLGLADTRGADKNKAHRLVLGRNAHAVAANGGGNGLDGLVLADNVLFQALVELTQAVELVLADAGGGDLCPQLDHAGKVVHRKLRVTLRAERVKLLLRLHGEALELGEAFKIRLLRALQQFALFVVILDLAAQLHAAVDVLIVQVEVGTGLVDEVDGLIGQEAVGDIALGEQHSLTQNALGDLDAVVLLIIVGNALQDLERILHIRLVDRNRLEAALERGVLFDVLAILGEGRRADDLNFAAGKGGL